MSIIFFACKETPCDIKEDINGLKQTKTDLQNDVQNFGEARAQKVHEIDSLNGVLKVLDIYKAGRTPRYVLKLHLKQTHYLSINKMIKDAINAIDFEMPVDKEFYDQVEVGTEIVNKFRTGSFWIEGSFGNWEMTVAEKEIK